MTINMQVKKTHNNIDNITNVSQSHYKSLIINFMLTHSSIHDITYIKIRIRPREP